MEHSGALNSHIKKLYILLLYNRKMSKNFNDTDFQKSPINIDGADINKMFIFDDFAVYQNSKNKWICKKV